MSQNSRTEFLTMSSRPKLNSAARSQKSISISPSACTSIIFKKQDFRMEIGHIKKKFKLASTAAYQQINQHAKPGSVTV